MRAFSDAEVMAKEAEHRAYARNAGKQGAGTHRNAGDSGRIAEEWMRWRREAVNRGLIVDTDRGSAMTDTPIAALIEAVEKDGWQHTSLVNFGSCVGLCKAAGLDKYRDVWEAYHGSRDAAKALREGLLPGWLHYGGWSQDAPHFFATVWHPYTEWEDFNAIGANEARTELAAILRAHQSQQETGQ